MRFESSIILIVGKKKCNSDIVFVKHSILLTSTNLSCEGRTASLTILCPHSQLLWAHWKLWQMHIMLESSTLYCKKWQFFSLLAGVFFTSNVEKKYKQTPRGSGWLWQQFKAPNESWHLEDVASQRGKRCYQLPPPSAVLSLFESWWEIQPPIAIMSSHLRTPGSIPVTAYHSKPAHTSFWHFS